MVQRLHSHPIANLVPCSTSMPKATGQLYRVDAKPAKGSRWVRIGKAHYARNIIEASFTPLSHDQKPDTNRPGVQMLVILDENRTPQIHELRISAAAEPLSATAIRVPLRSMARAAVSCLSYRLEGDKAYLVAMPGDTFTVGESLRVAHAAPERVPALEQEFRTKALRSEKPRLTENQLRLAAQLHHEAPHGRRLAVVEDHFKISRHTAKAWIRKARDGGFYPQ
jgi:hypothetical protein